MEISFFVYAAGGLIGLAVTLVLFLVFWCTTKETDFDEEIRKRNKVEDLLFPSKPAAKNGVKKEKHKDKKKNVKSVKKVEVSQAKKKVSKSAMFEKPKDKVEETSDHDTVTEDTEDDHKMVQYELDPEIINSEAPNVADMAKLRKRNKKPAKMQPQKSILLNKDEMPLVADVDERTGKVAETFHTDGVPLDDLELRHYRERRDSERSSKSQEIAVEENKRETAKQVHEKQQESSKKTGGKKDKKEKKKESTKLANGDGPSASPAKVTKADKNVRVQEEQIISMKQEKLQSAAVSHVESPVQQKQAKGENIMALQKQLQEKENIIARDHVTQQTLSQQLESIHQQLFSQQQQTDMLEKQLQAKAGENQALIQRLHQTHEQHLAEIGGLRQQAERGQQAQDELQRLKGEHMDLRSRMDKEIQQEREAVHSKTKLLVEQLSQTTLRINTLEDGKQILEKKLTRANEELKQKENQQRGSDSLAKKVKELGDEMKHKEQEISRLQANIKKAESAQVTAERKVADAQNKEQGTKTNQQQYEKRITELEEAKKKAEAEKQAAVKRQENLTSELEKVKNELQVVSHAQTVVQQEQTQQAAPSDDNTRKELQEKDQWVASLKADLEAQKQKNNTLEEVLKESKHQVTETETKLKDATEAVAKLRGEHDKQLAELQQLIKKNEALEKSTNQLTETAQRSSGLWEQIQQLQKDLGEKDTALSKEQAEAQQQKEAMQKLKESLTEMKLLETRCDEMTKKISSMEHSLGAKDEEISGLHEANANIKGQYEKLAKQNEDQMEAQLGSEEELQRDLVQVQQQLKSKSSALETAESELSNLRQTSSVLEQKINQHSGASELSKELLHQSKTQVEHLQQQLGSEAEAKSRAVHERLDLEQRLHEQEVRQQATMKELEEASHQLSQLKTQLEGLTSQELQNDSLQDAYERLKQEKEVLEKSLDEQISQAKAETSQQYQSVLQRLHPDITVEQVLSSEKEWIHTFESKAVHTKEVVTITADTSSLEAKLQQSLQEQEKLRGQVQHYHTVLSNTESILNQLQNSVDSEEHKWKEKAKQSTEQLALAQKDILALQEKLKQVEGSQETDKRVQMLEEEKQSLTLQYQAVSSSQPRLTDLEAKLKSLTSENVKLNAQIRIGQDALREEQGLVTDLREELAKKSIANGTNDLSEVEELKAKMVAVQKQLEAEVQKNKQLSQRLAAYGGFT